MYLFGFPEGLSGGSKETVYDTSFLTQSPTNHTTNYVSSWTTRYATGRSTGWTTSYNTASSWSTSGQTTTSWDTLVTTSAQTAKDRTYYYSAAGMDIGKIGYKTYEHPKWPYVSIATRGLQWPMSTWFEYATAEDSNGVYGTNWRGASTNQYTMDALGIQNWTADGDPLVNVGKLAANGVYIGEFCTGFTWANQPNSGVWVYKVRVPGGTAYNNLPYKVIQSYASYVVQGAYQGSTSWSTPLNNTSASTQTAWSTSVPKATSHGTSKQTFYLTGHGTGVGTSRNTAYNTSYNTQLNTSHITYG